MTLSFFKVKNRNFLLETITANLLFHLVTSQAFHKKHLHLKVSALAHGFMVYDVRELKQASQIVNMVNGNLIIATEPADSFLSSVVMRTTVTNNYFFKCKQHMSIIYCIS